MKKIAIIPARGGSKRIPKKNIKLFFGKPVISYAIEIANQSGLFDCIMVSTDDEEIKKISLLNGAEVPFLRSKQNSTDKASTFEVLKEVLNWYEYNGVEFDYACCIYPITPLLNVKYLEKGFKKLVEGKYDSVFPISVFSHPIQRALFLNKKGKVKLKNKNLFEQNTQDLPLFYHDTGQFYWFNSKSLPKKKLITDNSSSIILSKNEYQDVDNEEDWEILKIKYLNKLQ